MMQPYLVFTLSATLGAMGDLAGHERRGSWGWPGRSAILGLLGAALGIRRDGDFAGLDALSMAVAVFDDGHSLRDYHTVETVPSAVVKQANSRPEALRAAGKVRSNTTITLRDYRVGGLFGVAVWGGDLVPLAAALNAPQFTLYLGRKSCPLSAPPAPKVVEADGVESALAMVQLPPWRLAMTARFLVADAGPDDTHIEERHDRAIDRTLWHFAPRRVGYRTVENTAGGQA
ncbi:MAG: type I-E CRISPR-associated protein Cas5/CasD [Rhodobacteraceae bacterium]|nr:type I-E CRISPR-associated protein Cas5/CasD [Paracoccaceae bacterium]